MLPLLLAVALAPTVHASPKAAVRAKTAAAPAKTKLSPRLRDVLAVLGEPVKLTKAERAKVGKVVAAMPAPGAEANVPKAWAGLVKSWHGHQPTADINALIQLVIAQSYLEQNEDLAFYAAKVKHFNEAKAKLREHLKSERARVGKLAPQAK